MGTGEVIAGQERQEAGIWLECAGALRGIGDVWVGVGTAVGVEADGIQTRIDDAQAEIFGEEGVLVECAGFQIVNALYVGEIGAKACVGESAILPNGFLLNGPEIGERICAGIIVVGVPADEGAESEDGGRSN